MKMIPTEPRFQLFSFVNISPSSDSLSISFSIPPSRYFLFTLSSPFCSTPFLSMFVIRQPMRQKLIFQGTTNIMCFYIKGKYLSVPVQKFQMHSLTFNYTHNASPDTLLASPLPPSILHCFVIWAKILYTIVKTLDHDGRPTRSIFLSFFYILFSLYILPFFFSFIFVCNFVQNSHTLNHHIAQKVYV